MSRAPQETVGVFGGSFDPPHVAHTLLAAYALATCPIDRLIVVPTYQHAFGKRLAPFDARLAMCELAFADLRRVELSSVERDLGGTSRTLVTLQALQQRLPEAQLRLVIGSDLLAETDRWHAFDRIRELAPPIVVGRSGHEPDGPLPLALPPVSSTEIRARLAAGESVEGWVDRRVIAHAQAHGLYRNP